MKKTRMVESIVADLLRESNCRYDRRFTECTEGSECESCPCKQAEADNAEGNPLREWGFMVEDDDSDWSFSKKLKQKISEAIDFCKENPDLCRGNLGLSRTQMPVIEGPKVVDFERRLENGYLDIDDPPPIGHAGPEYLTSGDQKDDKVEVQQHAKIPVGRLKATQKEINHEKAEGMAAAAKEGKFDPTKEPIIVSSDNYILDGHHRWAAALLLNPSMGMTSEKVDLPVKKLLQVSNAYTDAIGAKRKAF